MILNELPVRVAPKVIDATSFIDRPNPGTNILGLGCLTGCQPGSVYNPLKTDELGRPISVRVFSKGDLMVEAEDGEGWTTDLSRRLTEKAAVIADLQKLAIVLQAALANRAQAEGITVYGAPLDWWTFSRANTDKLRSVLLGNLQDATTLWLSRVRPYTSRAAVDAHNFSQVPFEVWKASILWRAEQVRKAGLEVDLVWECKWHYKSDDASKADKPIPYDEARQRIDFLLSLNPRAIWLMGGDATVNQTWTRLPMSAYPDIGKIVQHLTTGRPA